MIKRIQSLLSLSIVVPLATFLVLFAACSTGGMDFTVSDQALNGNETVTASSSSPSQSTDQEEKESQPQVIIPENTTQQDETDAQIVPEAKENKENAELDCEVVAAPDVSYWPNRSPRGESQNLMMLDARLGAHFDFDRFVIEFEPNPVGGIEGPPDSYSIQWISQPPIKFGNGQVIQVEGTQYLEIQLHAYAYSRTEAVYEYAGPTKVRAIGTLNVIEAVFGGEVEGKMVWAIGANNRTGFRVLEISDPPRLVIDVCTSVPT
tara:strand:- start:130 stop:918 length:789 start_codon:yes stop_codon:yes gene_type:complete